MAVFDALLEGKKEKQKREVTHHSWKAKRWRAMRGRRVLSLPHAVGSLVGSMAALPLRFHLRVYEFSRLGPAILAQVIVADAIQTCAPTLTATTT